MNILERFFSAKYIISRNHAKHLFCMWFNSENAKDMRRMNNNDLFVLFIYSNKFIKEKKKNINCFV